MSKTMRYIVFTISILLLIFLLLGCDDPQCKPYHISIKNTFTGTQAMLYCDGYSYQANGDLELIGCSGHSATVVKRVGSYDVVAIEPFVCSDWED